MLGHSLNRDLAKVICLEQNKQMTPVSEASLETHSTWELRTRHWEALSTGVVGYLHPLHTRSRDQSLQLTQLHMQGCLTY